MYNRIEATQNYYFELNETERNNAFDGVVDTIAIDSIDEIIVVVAIIPSEYKCDWAICRNHLFVVVFDDDTMVTSFRSVSGSRYYGGSVENILGSDE